METSAATPLVGEAVCLTAAMLWATAVVLFRGAIREHGARTINLAKGLIATLLLTVTVLVVGGWSSLITAPPAHLGWLAASGLVGLTLGDTALFAAVGKLGAHNGLLLQTLAPVFAATLAFPLGERLNVIQLLGAALVLVGVMAVISSQRNGRKGASDLPPRVLTAGLVFGVLAAFGQGSGVVLAKLGMAEIPTLPATTFRLATSVAGLLVIAAFRGGLRPLTHALSDRATARRVVPASVIGTYLAMSLMMLGIALAPASIAAVLLATPPVFSLLLESWLDRTWPQAVGVAGTIVTVAGVAVLSVG